MNDTADRISALKIDHEAVTPSIVLPDIKHTAVLPIYIVVWMDHNCAI